MGRCSAAAGRAVSGVVAAPLVMGSELMPGGGKSPIRFGLMGLGQRGLQWAETLAASSAAELVAWYDPSDQQVNKAEFRFGKRGWKIPETAQSEQAIYLNPKVDVLLIASPSYLHCQQICQALESRKHVLTEKPVALGDSQLQCLNKLLSGNASDRILMVCNSRRRQAQRQGILNWLKTEPLGQLVDIQIDWTHPQGPPRGQNDWLNDPAKTGDWLAEHGDHLWDLIAEIHPSMPHVLNATRVVNPLGSSRFWKVDLILQNHATASIRHSMLPGSNFQSPGLSFLIQYQHGMVDLMKGRVCSDKSNSIEVPQLNSDSNELTDTLGQFYSRMESIKPASEISTANQSELQRAVWISQLRQRIETAMKNV